MQTYFIRSGSQYRLTDKSAINIQDYLPPATYSVGADMQGFFLETVDPLEPFEGKIYGNVLRHKDRIIRTFNDRKGNTGVLMSGEKGSGKTLLARTIAIELCEQADMPILLINQPFHGDEFNTFLQSISQPCVVLVDEYDKVYSEKKSENGLLTLLDGVFMGRKLFLLTSNSSFTNTYMQNRPGRVFYNIKFKHLDEAFVREYLEDHLKNRNHIQDVVNLTKIIPTFNFDMLTGLIQEMNRYDETVKQAMEILNISMPDYRSSFEVLEIEAQDGDSLDYKKPTLTGENGNRGKGKPQKMMINPFSHDYGVMICHVDEDGDDDFEHIGFGPDDLIDIDNEQEIYTYKNEEGWKVRIQKSYMTPPKTWHDVI